MKMYRVLLAALLLVSMAVSAGVFYSYLSSSPALAQEEEEESDDEWNPEED